MKTCMPDRGFCTCKLGVRCQKHTLRPEVLSLVGFVPAGAPIFSMSCRIDSAPFQQQRITELAARLYSLKSERLGRRAAIAKNGERAGETAFSCARTSPKPKLNLAQVEHGPRLLLIPSFHHQLRALRELQVDFLSAAVVCEHHCKYSVGLQSRLGQFGFVSVAERPNGYEAPIHEISSLPRQSYSCQGKRMLYRPQGSNSESRFVKLKSSRTRGLKLIISSTQPVFFAEM